MDSFYGGRAGASVVIKAAFWYLDPTDEYFLQLKDESAQQEAIDNNKVMSIALSDPNYKEVWYGEYCIIDAPNKNNKNNGKIYRRTLKNQTNKEKSIGNCCEYIGQIVGPAGPALQLGAIGNVKEIEQNFDDLTLNPHDAIYFKGYEEGNETNVQEFYTKEGNKTYNLEINDINPYNNSNQSGIRLIPGNINENDINENDNIKNYFIDDNNYIQKGGFNWYNIRLNTNDKQQDISKMYLGFDVPYYVTEFESGNTLSDISFINVSPTINSENNIQAPFYEKYQINIPRGLRGSWFSNLRSVIRESSEDYYFIDAIEYVPSTDEEDDYFKIKEEEGNDFTVSEEDWPVGAAGWVVNFNWKKVPHLETGEKEADQWQTIPNIFVGLHREIRDIVLDSDGTLTFNYTAWTAKPEGNILFSNYVKEKAIDYITNLEVDDNANLKITFNNDSIVQKNEDNLLPTGWSIVDNKNQFTKNLKLWTETRLGNDGTIELTRSDESVETLDTKLRWIEDVHFVKILDKVYNSDRQEIDLLFHVLIKFNNYPENTSTVYLYDNGEQPKGEYIDLGLGRTTQAGIYLYSSNSDTIDVTGVTEDNQTRAAAVARAIDILTQTHDNEKDRGIVVTLKYKNDLEEIITEETIFYYRIGDNSSINGWRELGSVSVNSSSSKINIDEIDIPVSHNGILFETTTLNNVMSLSTPWK